MLEQGMMSFALLGAGWVLWLLVLLSVLVIGIALERWWFLSRDGAGVGKLAPAVQSFLGGGDVDAFSRSLDGASMESRVLAAGLEVRANGVDAAQKAMEGTATAERLKLERGLVVIATVGSNAPFLGLFGTVLGIIKAFHDLASDMDSASTAVMAGISEALVATAVGLFVAIPAVVLYNTLSRMVRTRLSTAESLADLVLARLGKA